MSGSKRRLNTSGVGGERVPLSHELVQHCERVSRAAWDRHCLKVAHDVLAKSAAGSDPFGPLFNSIVRTLHMYAKVKAVKKQTRSKKGKSKNHWVAGTGFGGAKGTNASLIKGTTSAKNREKSDDVSLAQEINAFTQSVKDVLGHSRSSVELCFLGGLFNLSLGTIIAARSSPTKRKDGRSRLSLTPNNEGVTLCKLLRFYWRNDNLMDVGERLPLYSTLLELIALCGEGAPVCSGLPGVLFEEEKDTDDEPIAREKDSSGDDEIVIMGEANSSLLDKVEKFHVFAWLKKLNKQGKMFTHNIADSSVCIQDVARTTAFFKKMDRTIIGVEKVLGNSTFYRLDIESLGPVKKSQRRDLLVRLSLGGNNSAGDCSRPEHQAKLESGYCEALKDLQFRSVMFLELAAAHHKGVHYTFLDEARAVNTANRARMVRIGKEISSLATSLPLGWGSGVFIRSDESRPDVMCCLILGPEDTPYANGAFVFDIFLPATYPHAPPKVLLKTTGHGTVRFNPNLYNCGKVCLSLLGTWAGPGWDMRTSTLLQVLVSIQSLIMVSEPYFNEPGYERIMGTPQGDIQSKSYNRTIRAGTMRFAILDMIKNPPYLFRDVLELHFSLKNLEIRKQCTEWAADLPTPRVAYPGYGFGGGGGMAAMTIATGAEQINTALVKLLEESSKARTPVRKTHRTSTNAVVQFLNNDEDKGIVHQQPSRKKACTQQQTSSSSSSGVVDLT